VCESGEVTQREGVRGAEVKTPLSRFCRRFLASAPALARKGLSKIYLKPIRVYWCLMFGVIQYSHVTETWNISLPSGSSTSLVFNVKTQSKRRATQAFVGSPPGKRLEPRN
jgi:hypothetical protein